ncbi:very short patch repair endonuclease [Pseudomonas sp.]|uniref:very short patch repair endonuclease n=1 Tax=Pseudomonas sp. TaxID=306 RepID=UPI003FD6DB7C
MNRSEIMRSVKSENTTPELLIRSLLHRLGFRFRLHRKDLPGSPDVVLPRYRTVIFVHGCFWHRHPGCRLTTTPKSRQGYWLPKFMGNVERDRRNIETLQKMGWQVIVIWECEIKRSEDLEYRLTCALRNDEAR